MVVQDSVLKVFKHLDGFRGNRQFASWLTRITINQALMKVRGNTRKFVSIDAGVGAEDTVVLRDIRACGYKVMELYIEKDLSEV